MASLPMRSRPCSTWFAQTSWRTGRWGQVQKKRRSKKTVTKVHKYKPQAINWQASSVENLVSLAAAKSEPPLTRKLSNIEIQLLVEEPFQIPEYECISQFVERGSKQLQRLLPVPLELTDKMQ